MLVEISPYIDFAPVTHKGTTKCHLSFLNGKLEKQHYNGSHVIELATNFNPWGDLSDPRLTCMIWARATAIRLKFAD